MSDSAQSDRQHGTQTVETAAVDATAEVDLVDPASASLLLQSLDLTTSEETDVKLYEPAVTEPLMETEVTQDVSDLDEKLEVKDRASVDDKSSQEEHLQSHKNVQKDVVQEEIVDAVASVDKKESLDRARPAEATAHVEAASEQKADATENSAKRPLSAVLDSENVRHLPFVSADVDTGTQFVPEDEPSDSQGKQTTQPMDSSYEEKILVKTEEEEKEKAQHVAEEGKVDTEELTVVTAEGDMKFQDDEQRKFALEEATGFISKPTEEAIERDNIMAETNVPLQTTEPATPEVERDLSHYHLQMQKETQELFVTVEYEKHERKELTGGLTEMQQLHEAKLLCSSSESMVSSTTSDWTVIDTGERSETPESFSAVVSVDRDITSIQRECLDESASYMAQTEVAFSDESRRDVFEVKDKAFVGGLDEPVEDEDDEIDSVEQYLTATVTPTVDLMVMPTALESILEEEERTSSSQKTTSSSEKLEHDVSDSSKLVGSSPDIQHGSGKFTGGKSSDRDDVSVSSSLAEFERLETELQEKGSSESFSGDKGSSESASAAALPESPHHKSSTSLSSSLAEFERIEHEILGQSGSLELITIERRSHHTDSSSFSELERIEELEKNGASAEEQYRSSSGSLAEFEYIEQQLRLNEELESEALKVATMLEKGRASSAEKSPEAGSSQSDVRLSKEQIPESAESVSAEEIAQPAASAEVQYPHYQDIVHIIREASKSAQTFQFSDQETSHTSSVTQTVSQVEDSTKSQQEQTTLISFHAETSSVTTTFSEDASATASSEYLPSTEHTVLVEHSDIVRTRQLHSVKQELEVEKPGLTTTESVGITDLQSVEETDVIAEKKVSETVGDSLESEAQQREDADLMVLSTDSLTGVQDEDVMQLSADSLQPSVAMTTSTDSLEMADSAEFQRSSTSTLSSATTLLAADDAARCLMERSTDSLESDSREPSGEWVTVYEADSASEHPEERGLERDVMAKSTDLLEAEFGAERDQQLAGDESGGVSGSASYESFEADSLQDEAEEPTLVSSQSQDSLLVAGVATMPMDISFGSSGAWSQSNMSSCTTLASSSDGEALTCSADVSTHSGGGGAADRRLSEPSSTRSPTLHTAWSYDNSAALLDSEGNVLIAAVTEEARTPRPDDVSLSLDNRQSLSAERTDKPPAPQMVEPIGEASAAQDVPEPPGIS